MRLYEVIWKERFAEKIAEKHDVTTDEVEQALFAEPHVRLLRRVASKARIYTLDMGKQKRVGT